jgi:hypothetical protein
MTRMGKSERAWLFLGLLVAFPACAVDTSDPEPSGQFVPEPDDEVLDAADPPTDPDPIDDEEFGTSAEALSSGGAQGKCNAPSALLSPKGLTFVIHVSKHADKANRELAHLKKIRHYLRARDIFMIEHGSPVVNALHQLFPCNRFHYIAYPDEMAAALATGDGVDGIAVDWEGGFVESHSQGYSVDRLQKYRNKIHARGKSAGFVPAWSPSFDDGQVMHASKMDYELAQIQPACVNGPKHFANRAKALLGDFKAHGESLRNVGFEISMDSFAYASNHVGSERAAQCTRKAYGKGARAIYIYGNGSDHLVDYFHRLGKMGVRKPI